MTKDTTMPTDEELPAKDGVLTMADSPPLKLVPSDEGLDRNLTLHQIYLMWLISIKPSDFLRRNNILLHEIISFRGSQHNWGKWDD